MLPPSWTHPSQANKFVLNAPGSLTKAPSNKCPLPWKLQMIINEKCTIQSIYLLNFQIKVTIELFNVLDICASSHSSTAHKFNHWRLLRFRDPLLQERPTMRRGRAVESTTFCTWWANSSRPISPITNSDIEEVGNENTIMMLDEDLDVDIEL